MLCLPSCGNCGQQSLDGEVVTLALDEMLEMLEKMHAGHFESLLLRVRAPVHLLPGREAPQTTRAIELLSAYEAQGRLGEIEEVLLRVAVPPAPTAVSYRRLEILHEDRFLIRDPTGGLYELPWRIPEFPRHHQADAIREARHWKRLHTLTERLYRGYRQLHVHMLRCVSMGASDVHRVSAQSCVNAIRPYAEDFADDIGRLPISVGESPPIASLRYLPVYCDAIKWSVGNPTPSEPFADGLLLVEHIEHLLLNGLHIADMILEKYFEDQGSGA